MHQLFAWLGFENGWMRLYFPTFNPFPLFPLPWSQCTTQRSLSFHCLNWVKKKALFVYHPQCTAHHQHQHHHHRHVQLQTTNDGKRNQQPGHARAVGRWSRFIIKSQKNSLLLFYYKWNSLFLLMKATGTARGHGTAQHRPLEWMKEERIRMVKGTKRKRFELATARCVIGDLGFTGLPECYSATVSIWINDIHFVVIELCLRVNRTMSMPYFVFIRKNPNNHHRCQLEMRSESTISIPSPIQIHTNISTNRCGNAARICRIVNVECLNQWVDEFAWSLPIRSHSNTMHLCFFTINIYTSLANAIPVDSLIFEI